MAHLAKFSGGVEGAKMYAHWTREIDDQGCPITYAKEHGGAGHIDRNLTAKNYTLGIIWDISCRSCCCRLMNFSLSAS